MHFTDALGNDVSKKFSVQGIDEMGDSANIYVNCESTNSRISFCKINDGSNYLGSIKFVTIK